MSQAGATYYVNLDEDSDVEQLLASAPRREVGQARPTGPGPPKNITFNYSVQSALVVKMLHCFWTYRFRCL